MTLKVTMTSNLRFNMADVPPLFVDDLKESLIISNPAYINGLRYARGGRRFDVAPFLFCIWRDGDDFIVPRGFARRLFTLCHKHRIPFEVDDKSASQAADFVFSGTLYGYQAEALSELAKRRFGLLVGPLGCGKRVTALALIAECQIPALIVVSTRRQLYLWKELIRRFLALDENEIGQVGDGVRRFGKITIAVIDSLYRVWDEAKHTAGFLLVDRAETAGLNIFRRIVLSFEGRNMLGLCNQRERADGLTAFMTAYLGEVIHEIKLPGKFAGLGADRPRLTVRKTSFSYLYRDDFKDMITTLCRDSERNALIAADILQVCAKPSVRALALSDRVEHLKAIKTAIAQAQGPEAAIITGETTEKARQEIMARFQKKAGLLLMTYRSLQAVDLCSINHLLIMTPVKNGDYISQAAGALVAGSNVNHDPGAIYDYRDVKVSVLDSSFQKRRKLYAALGVMTEGGV